MGNTSSSRYDSEPTLAKVNQVLRWFVGLVMFLTAVIYAGVRGYYAYNHEPAVQVNPESRSYVTFPAITFCPIEPGMELDEDGCILENKLNPVIHECAVKQTDVSVSGVPYKCITYNSPVTPNEPVLGAASIDDELSLEVKVPLEKVVDHLGVLVILHDQSKAPQHNTDRSFWAQLGMAAEVYLRLDEYHYVDGRIENRWSAGQIGTVGRKLNDTYDVVDVDLQFTDLVVYVNREYFVYNVNEWYGEVGGLSFLLWCLYTAFCFLFMEVVSRAYRAKYGVPANAEIRYTRHDV